MKNNKIKIILFLSAITILGLTTNINAMKNTNEKKEISNKIDATMPNQNKNTQENEEKIYKKGIDYTKIEKQMNIFNEEFLKYSENLAALKKPENFNTYDKTDLKKIIENYKKQKEEIKKIKNEYEAFLNINSKVISYNNEEIETKLLQHLTNIRVSIERNIEEIDDDIKEIDDIILSNLKFDFDTSVEREEESSFDIDSDGSIFDGSSDDENKEKKEVKITRRLVNKYIEDVNALKMQILNDIEKLGVDAFKNMTFSYHPTMILQYANLHKENNPEKFDMEKFLQQLKKLGYLDNIDTKNTKFTMKEDLKEYLLLVLDDISLSISSEFDANNEKIYCNQNDEYIKFLNNIDTFRNNNSHHIDGKIEEIDRDINLIYNKKYNPYGNQIKTFKDKFNQNKQYIYKKIKEIFEDEIRHIFRKVESVDMEVPVSEEETKNLLDQLNALIENKFKDVKNKYELKNAVDEIFKEAREILKSHNFSQMKDKEIKFCVENYIKMLNARMGCFVKAMNHYSKKYENVAELKDKHLDNIVWLYFSVAKYFYFAKDSQEIDEKKFLEKLTIFNKNKIDYKLDEEDKKNLKKVFNGYNTILNNLILKFFKNHEKYENKFKEKLSKIIKETSTLSEIQKLCFFNKMKNLSYKNINKKIFDSLVKARKYKNKVIKKVEQIIKNRNALNSLDIFKANNNLISAEKFFKELAYYGYDDYDIQLMLKAQVLKKIMYTKHLNNIVNKMAEVSMSTINQFKDIILNNIILNNREVSKNLIENEITKCNENKEYIEKNLPIALKECNKYSHDKNINISPLAYELKTETKNLQNSYNELKNLKEKIKYLARVIPTT